MNGTMKVAALAALLASASAFANEDPSQTQQPATPEAGAQATEGQWPEFSTADTNGDGYLSRDEARASPALVAVFADLDADKNGSLSSTEYQKGKEMQKPKSSDESATQDPATTQDPAATTPPQQ